MGGWSARKDTDMNNFECYKDRCRDCACLSDYDGKWYCEKSDEPRPCEDVAKCSVGTIDVAKMGKECEL